MKIAAIAAGAMVLGAFAQAGVAADGKAVYSANCGACHNVMAPKLGDKKAWAPRLGQGEEALVASVTKGKGAMPAKAGKAALSDADIKAAVEYIMQQGK